MFRSNGLNSNRNNVTRNNELFFNYKKNVTKVIECKGLSLNVYLRSQINPVILTVTIMIGCILKLLLFCTGIWYLSS